MVEKWGKQAGSKISVSFKSINSRILKILKQTPEKYIDSEVESMATAINAAFIFFPLFLTVVLVRQILQSDFDMTILIGFGILVSLAIRQLFLRGELQKSMMLVAVFFTLLLTAVCTLGNGIHDIGLIGFPIIIGFSSIILDQKQLIIASILSILGLSWLVIGDRIGLFIPVPIPVGSLGDFIITGLLISIGGFVAFSLTRNMRDSLKKAQNEIEASKSEATHLAEQIDQKEEIIEEIHRAVINSLAHIKHLIDQNPERSEEFTQVYESLRRKIIVIEAAHSILLEDKAPILLDVKELTREILSKYEKRLNTSVIHMDIDHASCTVSLDQAIHYGILLIELIHQVDQYSSEAFNIMLNFQDGKIELKLNGFENDANSDLSVVMDLLTKQLKGSLQQEKNEVKLSFEPSKKK